MMKEDSREIIILDEGIDLDTIGPMAVCCSAALIPYRR